jgi:hypothetical protein
MLIFWRSRLFSISNRLTVFREIPSREVRPVFWMLTSPAWLTPASKLRDWSLGRAFHLMEPTEVSSEKASCVRRVRPSRLKASPMEVREAAVMSVTFSPPEQMMEPVTVSIPAREREPEKDLEMVISPFSLEQEAIPSASDWASIVVSPPG